jgi:hypothetical protein
VGEATRKVVGAALVRFMRERQRGERERRRGRGKQGRKNAKREERAVQRKYPDRKREDAKAVRVVCTSNK